MVGAAGFEPAALWSQTRCATKLRYAPISSILFILRRKSNHQFYNFYVNLTFMVGAAGFEPAALWSQTRCATKLRYAPMTVYYFLWQGMRESNPH